MLDDPNKMVLILGIIDRKDWKSGCCSDIDIGIDSSKFYGSVSGPFRIYNWLRTRDSNPEPCG
jgi:hypothetical protein